MYIKYYIVTFLLQNRCIQTCLVSSTDMCDRDIIQQCAPREDVDIGKLDSTRRSSVRMLCVHDNSTRIFFSFLFIK